MKILDLFSGIGGFSLGLERAGMETIAFCEIEPYCQKILKKHWPGVPVFPDVKKLSSDDLPVKPDLICGGYPCQPFSTAGKQRGLEDDRFIWPEMLRLIAEIQPNFIIAENVYGHIRLGLDNVLSDLESQNYTVWPFVIPACAVGAPHRRDRVWLVGYSQHYGLSTIEKLGESGKNGERGEKGPAGFIQPSGAGTPGGGRVLEMVSRKKDSEQQPESADKFTRFTQWDTEPDVGRVADGLPGRVDRIRALGNAVVPQITETIGRVILSFHAANTR